MVQGTTQLYFMFHENGKKLSLKTPKKITVDHNFLQEVEHHNFGIHITW